MTVSGENKRKHPSSSTKNIPEVSRSEQQQQQMDQHFAAVTDPFAGPSPKQRRYEEGMSTKLGNIRISPGPSDNQQQQQPSFQFQQQTRPKIEEVFDWDEELLDEDDDDVKRPAAAKPIVEEPNTTTATTLDMEPGTSEQRTEKEDHHGGKGWHLKIEELEDDEDGADDEQLEEEEQQQQKIVLNEQLRQIIQQDRLMRAGAEQYNGRQLVTPLMGRSPHGSGLELILYVPSPLSQRIQPVKPPEDSPDEEVLQIQSAGSSPTRTTRPSTSGDEAEMLEEGATEVEEDGCDVEEAMETD